MSLSDVESEARAPKLGFKFPGAVTTLAIVVVLVWVAALFIPAGIAKLTNFAGTVGYIASAGLPLPVSVLVPTALPALSAATEVAAYRIVVEALTNVARHASATRASVSFAVGDRGLVLTVRDDGGAGSAWTPGVGIASMRERALQVGGTLTAYATDVGGVVEAALPLGVTE